MKRLHIPLRAVFYKEGRIWVAHCLEFDLMGDGKTKKEAVENLKVAIGIQIEASVKFKNPDNLFSPADGKFFRMFAAGKNVACGNLTIEPVGRISIESMETREYSASDSDLAFA